MSTGLCPGSIRVRLCQPMFSGMPFLMIYPMIALGSAYPINLSPNTCEPLLKSFGINANVHAITPSSTTRHTRLHVMQLTCTCIVYLSSSHFPRLPENQKTKKRKQHIQFIAFFCAEIHFLPIIWVVLHNHFERIGPGRRSGGVSVL